MKRIVPLLILLLTAPALLFAWGGNGGWCGYGPVFGWNHGFYGGGGFMIFTFILLILLLGFIFKYFSKGVNVPGNRNEALDILKTRYAKGEITKEVFESMKKDLA